MAAPTFSSSQQKLILNRLQHELDKDPPLLALKVPAKLPVMTKEGFKTIPIATGQEFLGKSFRFGARDGLIMMAEPADDQEWDYAEFNQSRLTDWFPSRALEMCRWLGSPNANSLVIAMTAFVEEQEREELAAVAKAIENNQDNKMWGMFS